MKKTITAILAIALMAIPTSAIAHIETWEGPHHNLRDYR